MDERRWTDLAHDGADGLDLDLDEVLHFDADAVRLCDGYEYRYHRGGSFTWFAFSSGEELPVKRREGLPGHRWRHLPGCDCALCRSPK